MRETYVSAAAPFASSFEASKKRLHQGMHDVDNTRVKESGHFTDSGAELLGFDAGAKWVTAAEFRPGDVVVLAMVRPIAGCFSFLVVVALVSCGCVRVCGSLTRKGCEHQRCLHGSIRNRTADTLRLSCDVRFQPRSDAFDERWHVPYRGHGRFRDGEWLSSVGGASGCSQVVCSWLSSPVLPLLRAGADQPGGGMRRDEEKTMSLEEAKRDLWRLKPAL
eukprot:COSAG04_NODE_322_length_16880_cov_9.938621_10_plen_220_part_00